MNLRKRLLATASALTLFAGVGFLASAPAGAVVTFNVAHDHVTCNTLTGTVKFTSHLKLSGPTTGAQTTKVTAALGGCRDDDNAAVHLFKGAITATLVSNGGWNCIGLSGVSAQTANTTIVWTAGTGQGFTPKTTVGLALKQESFFNITQTNGTTFLIPSGQGPWTGGGYGEFQIGNYPAFGPTAAPTVTGATTEFDGNDGGITSWFAGTVQQDVVNILTSCGSTAGLSTISFGLGAVHLG